MKQEKSNRGRKGYPLDLKWKVIDDLPTIGESIATTNQRYGITARTTRNWLHILSAELPDQSIMSKANKSKDVDPEYAELKRESVRLKAVLFQAEGKALANKTPLEVVLDRYRIDLKKETDL